MAKFGRDVCRGHWVMLKPVCTVIAAYIRATTAKFGRDVCKGHQVMLKSVCTVIAAYIRATAAKFGRHVSRGHCTGVSRHPPPVRVSHRGAEGPVR